MNGECHLLATEKTLELKRLSARICDFYMANENKYVSFIWCRFDMLW